MNQILNAMKYIRKYSIAIICALILLFAGKSCQSCSRGRVLDYQKAQYEHIVDSLNAVNRTLDVDLQVAGDSIKILNTEIVALKEMNGMIQGSLDHARKTNTTLIKTINQ